MHRGKPRQDDLDSRPMQGDVYLQLLLLLRPRRLLRRGVLRTLPLSSSDGGK